MKIFFNPGNPDSGIREIFGILGFGIRNPESGIEVKESGILNPSSTDKDWNPSLKFRILDRLVIPHTGRALPFITKPSYGEIFCHPNF